MPGHAPIDRPVSTGMYNRHVSRSIRSLTTRRLLLDVGAAVRDARQALGWSQADLARRCGLSQATVSNVERCDGDASIGTIGAVLDALSIRPELRLRSPFVDRRPQRDVVHRPCVAYVDRRLAAGGWDVELEVEVTDDRMHGWIDILAFDPFGGARVEAGN